MSNAREPRILIVGAQKGGTTSLASALSADSRFWLPNGETPLFEDPIYDLRGAETLEGLRASAPAGKIAAIKRPDWLGRPEAPARMAQDCPDAVVVCALRSRAERTVSAYYWYLQTRLIPFLPLNDGLSRILDHIEFGGSAPSPRASEVVTYSLYGAGIERILTAGYEREKVLVGHARSSGPAEFDLLKMLQRSFDLDTAIGHSQGRRRNPGVYDYRRIRLLRGRSRILDRGRHDSVAQQSRLLPALSFTSKSVTTIERTLFARWGDTSPADLRPDIRERLDAHFQADDERFEAAVGHALSTVLGVGALPARNDPKATRPSILEVSR